MRLWYVGSKDRSCSIRKKIESDERVIGRSRHIQSAQNEKEMLEVTIDRGENMGDLYIHPTEYKGAPRDSAVHILLTFGSLGDTNRK